MKRGPRGLHAALRWTYAATFLFGTATGLFLLLPVYLQQVGSSPAQIGFVAGLLRISSLVARPVGGRLLDRLGRRPVITVGGGLASLAILSLFVFPQVGWPFFLMRILQGAGTALFDTGLSAVVADLAPPASRAQVFAFYSVWVTVPGAIMPALGEGVARHAGFFPIFMAAALVIAASVLLVRRLPETVRPLPEKPAPLRGMLPHALPIMAGCATVGVVFGAVSTFVPVAEIAEAPGRIGLFFFAYFVGLIGVRIAGAAGLSWVGSPGILLPAYAAMACGLLVLPLGDWLVLLLAVGLACGAGHGSVIPVLYSVLLFGVPKERRGMGVALLAASFDLGAILSSIGLGLLAEWVGYRWVFPLAAVGVAALAAASRALARR
ncbi:MAG: MFS transporter [Candidatus Methylomirabilales bacterium]